MCRIQVLHGEVLEKDAVIRVLQQRSRREQQGLRQALSAPSFTGAGDSTGTRGEGTLEECVVQRASCLRQLSSSGLQAEEPRRGEGGLK